MRKTLLNALKHGSGTIFILLSMMLGVSLQAWGSDPTNAYYDFKYSANGGSAETMDSGNQSREAGDVYSFVITEFHGNWNKNDGNLCDCQLRYKRKDNSTGDWVDADWITVAKNGQNWDKNPKEFWGTGLTVDVLSGLDNGSYTLYAQVYATGYPSGTSDCSNTYCVPSNSTYMTVSFTKVPVQYALGGWLNNALVNSYDATNWGMTESSGTYTGSYIFTAVHESSEFLWVLGIDNSTWGVDSDVDIALGGSTTIYNGKTGGKVKAPAEVGEEYTVTFTPASSTTGTLAWNRSCDKPTVTTSSTPSDKDDESATLTGSYTTTDVCAAVSKGIAYKASGAADYTLEADGTSSSGSISVALTGLSPLTTYYYKAYVEISGSRYVYGNEYSFTTDCQLGITVTGPDDTGEGPKCFGESFTALSVSPSGASGYTYQWYYNTTNSTTEGSIAISGATSSSYTPAVVGGNYYYCAVGATGGYCEVNSNYSGKVTINATPTLSVSESSVTNYAPVTVTAKGADIATWSVDTPANNSDCYLYKKTASSAKFKAKVNASATYTITGTTANSCSNTATVTVTTDSQDCH